MENFIAEYDFDITWSSYPAIKEINIFR